MKRSAAYTFAFLGGAAAWTIASRIGGEAEAWDAPVYLEAALPALAAFVALLGFWLRERVGALGIAASVGQMIGLAATRGEHAMWFVDAAFLSAQAIPFGVCAWLGGRVRGALGATLRTAARGARFCSRRTRRLRRVA